MSATFVRHDPSIHTAATAPPAAHPGGGRAGRADTARHPPLRGRWACCGPVAPRAPIGCTSRRTWSGCGPSASLRDDAGFSVADIAELLDDDDHRDRATAEWQSTDDPAEQRRIATRAAGPPRPAAGAAGRQDRAPDGHGRRRPRPPGARPGRPGRARGRADDRRRQRLRAAARLVDPASPAYRWWLLAVTSLGALLASLTSGTLVIALPDILRTCTPTCSRCSGSWSATRS